MNPVEAFLDRHAAGLGLEPDLAERMIFIVVTPRFRASRHVVFLGLLPERAGRPVLVAKLPRLRDDRSGIEHEARMLAAIGTAAPALDSVPRLVAFDDSMYPLLLETALAGSQLTRADVRRRPSECVDAVLAWLADLHALERGRRLDRGAYEALVERPLRDFSAAFGPDSAESALVERTLPLLDRLVDQVPLLWEHGDLSEPNLIWLEDGRVGVVDWELASLDGLPAQDLSFFLTYVAFARERAETLDAQRRAFHSAFVAKGGWALPALASQLDALDVDVRLVEPLLVACFARQTASLLARVGADDGSDRTWIRENRFYALWEHALDHVA